MIVTKQQHLYESLRERILTGRYGPGYRVVIDQIAAEFGVSSLPVREAIRRLEAEGLVIYRPNAGAQVAPVEPEAFEENMAMLAVLDGYATALAAPAISDEDLDALIQHTNAMVDAMGEMDSLMFGRCNRAFHEVIYAKCPNTVLVSMLREVAERLDAIRRTVFVHIPYRGAKSVQEHHELIELIREGSSLEEIERVARGHKLRTLESFRLRQQNS